MSIIVKLFDARMAIRDYKRWPELFDTVAEIYSWDFNNVKCRYELAVNADKIMNYLKENNRKRTLKRIVRKHSKVIEDMRLSMEMGP